MRRSSNHMLPASSSVKPAIIRSSVVLPHPEGPRRVNNLPSSIVAETLSTARTAPKVRLTPSRRIVVMRTTVASSARVLDDRLDPVQRRAASLVPLHVVVGQDLDLGERRHGSRHRGEIDVLPGGATEGRLEQHFLRRLAGEIVDQRTSGILIGRTF